MDLVLSKLEVPFQTRGLWADSGRDPQVSLSDRGPNNEGRVTLVCVLTRAVMEVRKHEAHRGPAAGQALILDTLLHGCTGITR